MLTLTFAGDESGDVSFSFDKGASRYFVVAVIATAAPESLRQLLADVRERSGLPVQYEFSFNALSSAPLRRRTFEALAEADFEGWAVVVDKTTLPDSFRVMRRLDFYLYFVTELVRLIPANKREGATLILDEFGSPAQLRTELRRFMTIRGIPRHFKHIQVRRSKSESLIQVADLVAGAILRRDAKGQVDAFDTIEKKLSQVLEFRS
jgi:hypothetical protein